jgi:UDP-N-acetylglucosamine 2-epimerase (non-hydrolysing)
MHILHVVGARPNFMKAAPVIAALQTYPQVQQTLVHTGQHYDTQMSDVFFRELGLPEPDINLEVGSGSHAVQTAHVMLRFEEVVLARRPDWVLVYGDINSTVAAALVCAKLQIPIGHVEAGLRSFDRTMPEELNRLVTDQLADRLFTPSEDGNVNLEREGIAPDKIRLVGNVMIDTLVRLLPQASQRWPALCAQYALCAQFALRDQLDRTARPYVLVTLHRPSNVDEPRTLQALLTALDEIGRQARVLFPVHPRTRQRMTAEGLIANRIQFCAPFGYLDFLALQQQAALVITDSGGIQEETTYLQVPCLTVRDNTERPITVTLGTNQLVGQDLLRLQQEAARILQGQMKAGQIPPLWDGHAAQRIAASLAGVG